MMMKSKDFKILKIEGALATIKIGLHGSLPAGIMQMFVWELPDDVVEQFVKFSIN